MDITSLKVVLLVQTQGSLAGAARVLGVDPSSVSRTVATVEADLGIRLFQRTTRRLSATEEGETYLRRLAPLLNEMEAAKEEAQQKRFRPSGLLRVTASVSFAHEVIMPLLPTFQKLYPDIAIDLQGTDTPLDLLANEVDLAIRLTPEPKGDLVATRLVDVRYKAVASPEFIAANNIGAEPAALADLNCVRFALPTFGSDWLYRRRGSDEIQSVTVAGNFKGSNALSLREAARMGIGVSVLSDWLITDDLSQGRLVELYPNYDFSLAAFGVSAWALYPSRSYLARKVRVMLDFLRQELREV